MTDIQTNKYCYAGYSPQKKFEKWSGNQNDLNAYCLENVTFVINTSITTKKNDLQPYFLDVFGPLKCIFKKPETDINKDLVTKNKTFVFTLKLKQDPYLLKEYINIHKPEAVWQEIIKNMDTMGVLNMELFLHEYRVFMIMTTIEKFNADTAFKQWSSLPREKEWQNYVSKFQHVDDQEKILEKWRIMKPIQKINEY
ncbi:L-rhamnose mutarotase [Aestuariibaculum sediminum]|uniref:L-rhamnose mutarotase n=1 Tax=Aestuariibaculum sediminum TaxID=2770637 RepID=A0A8J6U870_9FLAO|nr:L-rhamnose mutarotase [Aestuariibaculum sediminum]MBD0832935.1 L-rhamnose mutarotase [Aestuariibaculum sediminum]